MHAICVWSVSNRRSTSLRFWMPATNSARWLRRKLSQKWRPPWRTAKVSWNSSWTGCPITWVKRRKDRLFFYHTLIFHIYVNCAFVIWLFNVVHEANLWSTACCKLTFFVLKHSFYLYCTEGCIAFNAMLNTVCPGTCHCHHPACLLNIFFAGKKTR